MTTYYLALLETSGNQSYLFATNKLRENVGASELTNRATVDWVWDAVAPNWRTLKGDRSMADLLLDVKVNPPLEGNSADDAVEILLATSGKALILAKTAEGAKKVVRSVTHKALEGAPGLDLTGVVVDFSWESADPNVSPIDQAIASAHKELTKQRGRIPGPDERFLRLPVVADCRTSGHAAHRFDTEDLPKDQFGRRSKISTTKRLASRAGQVRMNEMVKRPGGWPMVDSLDELEKLDWLAVIHADGNSLGKVFRRFNEHLESRTNRAYITGFRHFSLALDAATIGAFKEALAWLQRVLERRKRAGKKISEELPVVPLVLGGDDLSIVCDGRLAVQFVKKFLEVFEQLTRRTDWIVYGDIIPRVMRKFSKNAGAWVTSKAGVAIIKPHFPFHAAYELSGQLMDSARSACGDKNDEFKAYSGFDFHVLYDASGADLRRIRAELTSADNARLFARPYVASLKGKDQRRTAESLEKRIKAIHQPDDDNRRALPNKLLHELREALFLGEYAAEDRLRLVRDRYANKGIDELLEKQKLFWTAKDDDNKEIRVTALLDAMDLAEFWTKENQP